MKVILLLVFLHFAFSKDFSKYFENDGDNVGYFWFFSDSHVHYEYKEGANPDCSHDCCCYEKTLVQKKKSGKYGYINRKDVGSKCDIPKLTSELVLKFMANFQNVTIDAVLFGGDIPAHDLHEQTLKENLDHLYYFYDTYVKTFTQYSPNTKIVATIGNHDTYRIDEVDYPEEGKTTWLLSNFTELFRPFLSRSELEDIPKIGAYKTYMDESKGFKIISLHSNYYCKHNKYVSKYPHFMADWLRKELEYSRDHSEKVLLLGHIPLRTGATWVIPEWVDDFIDINEEFSDIIVGQVYGHYHVNYFDMVLDKKNEKYTGVQWVINSVTNGYENVQPSAKLFKYNKDTFEILDYVHFYNDLQKSNEEKNFEKNWKVLYTAKEEYGLLDMSPQSYGKLMEELKVNEELYDKFMRNVFVNYFDYTYCVDACKVKFLCMMSNSNLALYEKCMKNKFF